MPIIPPNEELQRFLNQSVAPVAGGAFDAAWKARLMEQEGAQKLFETLARANPDLASAAVATTPLARFLTEPPSTFRGKGEPSLGSKVEGAFKSAAALPAPPVGLKPDEVRQATKTFSEMLKELGATGADLSPYSGKQERMVTLMAAGQPWTSDNTGLTQPQLDALLGTPKGEHLSLEQLYTEHMERSGKLGTEEGLLSAIRAKADAAQGETGPMRAELLSAQLELAAERLAFERQKTEEALKGGPIDPRQHEADADAERRSAVLQVAVRRALESLPAARSGDAAAAQKVSQALLSLSMLGDEEGKTGFALSMLARGSNYSAEVEQTLKGLLAIDDQAAAWRALRRQTGREAPAGTTMQPEPARPAAPPAAAPTKPEAAAPGSPKASAAPAAPVTEEVIDAFMQRLLEGSAPAAPKKKPKR